MKNKKGKILRVFAAAIPVIVFFMAANANAAVFSLTAGSQAMIGRDLTLTVSIDTEDRVLNAVGGEIVFPDDLLAVRSINDGNSMVNFWVESPHVQNNKIIFSGIVPGGYYGDAARLFDIVFTPKTIGSGAVSFNNLSALLNDGSGTAAAVTANPWPFTVSNEEPSTPPPQPKIDHDRPESFVPEISATPGVFDGKYFLSFLTQDKGSGIDHYEVKETRDDNADSGVWIKAASPYLLKDQQLKSYIYVKAVDNSGNARIVKLAPTNQSAWYEKPNTWGIMLLIAIFAAIFIIWRTNAHRKN